MPWEVLGGEFLSPSPRPEVLLEFSAIAHQAFTSSNTVSGSTTRGRSSVAVITRQHLHSVSTRQTVTASSLP